MWMGDEDTQDGNTQDGQMKKASLEKKSPTKSEVKSKELQYNTPGRQRQRPLKDPEKTEEIDQSPTKVEEAKRVRMGGGKEETERVEMGAPYKKRRKSGAAPPRLDLLQRESHGAPHPVLPHRHIRPSRAARSRLPPRPRPARRQDCLPQDARTTRPPPLRPHTPSLGPRNPRLLPSRRANPPLWTLGRALCNPRH